MLNEANTPIVPLEHLLGQFHSLAALFPIIIFTAVLICDLVHSFGKNKAFVIGHWLVILGVISCIPAILTGLEAAKAFDPNNELVQKHSFLGYATGISASFYAGLRISAMLWEVPISKKWYLLLSVLLLALVSWTCDTGILNLLRP